jgi:hypothetical protein
MQEEPTGVILSGEALEDCRRLAVSGVFAATRATDGATRVKAAVRLLVSVGELDWPSRIEPSAPVVDALVATAIKQTRATVQFAISLTAEADAHERDGLEVLARQSRVRADWALAEGNRAKRVLWALRPRGEEESSHTP